MPACGLHWLPANNIYFSPPFNTRVVAEAWKSLEQGMVLLYMAVEEL